MEKLIAEASGAEDGYIVNLPDIPGGDKAFELVAKFCYGVIPQEVVQALYSSCKSGNFELAEKEVNNVIVEGYPVSQMISQLFDLIIGLEDVSDEQKARIFKKMGEADKVIFLVFISFVFSDFYLLLLSKPVYFVHRRLELNANLSKPCNVFYDASNLILYPFSMGHKMLVQLTCSLWLKVSH